MKSLSNLKFEFQKNAILPHRAARSPADGAPGLQCAAAWAPRRPPYPPTPLPKRASPVAAGAGASYVACSCRFTSPPPVPHETLATFLHLVGAGLLRVWGFGGWSQIRTVSEAAGDHTLPRTEPVVSAEWLHANLKDPDVKVRVALSS